MKLFQLNIRNLMSLSNEQIKKIAKLARIRVEDAELEKFSHDLNNILHLVESLSKVDTRNVPQMTGVSTISLPRRVDEVSDGHRLGDVLANARHEHDCFIVPKVVENE